MSDINNNYTPGPLENNLIRDINANTGESYDDINHIVADMNAIFQAYPNGNDSQRVLADASQRADITKLGFPAGSFLTGISQGPIIHGQAPNGHDLQLFNNNIGNFGLMRTD